MTEQIIEILKRNETLSGNNEFIFIPRYRYATMANEIIEAIEVMRCCVNDDCKKTKALEEDNEQRKENFNAEVGLLKTVKMDSDLLGSLNTLMKNDKFKKPTKKRF